MNGEAALVVGGGAIVAPPLLARAYGMRPKGLARVGIVGSRVLAPDLAGI